MEKLEILLQDMVVRKFGKRRWHSIIQKSLPLCDFEQHIESYGPQRVASLDGFPPGPEGGAVPSAGSLLLDSAAEFLDTTVPAMLEQLGGNYAHSLQDSACPARPFTSDADYFSATAFYYNSCAWILDAVVPGSLRVNRADDGHLKIQCALRENGLWSFLKGFLSEALGGLDGPADVTHSVAPTPQGEIIHSFALPGGAALEPGHRTGHLALVG